MQNNNSNSESWKQRLDAFEAPSASFNSAAAWEKLQQRNESPVQKKHLFNYWMAAAGLILICLIAFLWKKNTGGVALPADQIVVKPIQPVSSEQLPVVIKTKITTTETVQAAEPVKADKQANNTEPIQHKTVSSEHIVTVEANPVVPGIMDTVAIAAQPVSTPSAKLKVIHLNELNTVPGNNTGIAREEGRPYFPVSYQSKKVYTNTTEQAIKKEKNNLVRIKLFP